MQAIGTVARAAIVGWLRALANGDAESLRRLGAVGDGCPAVAQNVGSAALDRLAAGIERGPIGTTPLAGNRHVVRASPDGEPHLFLLHERGDGPVVDERAFAASFDPEGDRQAVVRAFLGSWLRGDAAGMRAHCEDGESVRALLRTPPRIVRELAQGPQPPRLVIVELATGDVLHVGGALEFVGAHHAACGVAVLSGLTHAGELPFLLQQRDGRWLVLPAHLRRLEPAAAAAGGEG